MTTDFYLDQKLDGQGNPEEFINSGDLILPKGTTDHLNDDGLPPVGSRVYPGMLLIAKFGATPSYRREALPTYLESRTLSEEELLRRFKHMLYDGSFYVPKGVFGTVKEAFFESRGTFKRAVVRVEISERTGK